MIKDHLDPRVSYQAPEQLYFWTATIHKWRHLFTDDTYKEVIIESLKYLSYQRLVEIYGFVIMPNHLHLLWSALRKNGKESPQGSFLKYTAHEFKRMLIAAGNTSELSNFAVNSSNKKYEFWQRDPMAIRLFDGSIAGQKLTYTHLNPTTKKWQLATEPADYRYSSAAFYSTGCDDFGFLKNLYEAFSFGF